MSTPDSDFDVLTSLVGVTGNEVTSAEGAAASTAAELGVPDVALLSRWANEMFKAMPGALGGSVPGALGGSVPGALGGSVPGALGAVPAGLPTSTDAVPNAAAWQALSGALPGSERIPGFSGAVPAGFEPGALSSLTSVPSYYFLGGAGALPGAGAMPGAGALPGAGAMPGVDPFTFSPELVPQALSASRIFDAAAIRRDFPILEQRVHGKPLVWLDNAATTQKPNAVIDRISRFYREENSNIHRAAHELAGRATDAYEAARESARRFLNASSTRDIVFVRGTTEGINFVAQSWGRRHIQAGDEILISWLEHHSNIVPWQLLASERGAKLKVAPVDDRGQVLLDEYERLLGPKTKLVSLTHVSNALGTVLPVEEMTKMAQRHGARVLIDGAQAVSHMAVDVQRIGCDWYVFSGHKVFGPTGIGVVCGRPDALAESPPWQGGGNMIVDVRFEKTVVQPPPMRFEAGTGNIADAVGLGAALDYLQALGLENVSRHEHDLLHYGMRKLSDIPGLRLIGTAPDKAGVMSFVLDGFRSEEVGAALDQEGIAVRAGHHCAQPALRRYGLETSVRPSLALYNTCADIDALIDALKKLVGVRGQRTTGGQRL